MYHRKCCNFDELKIVGSFRKLYYIQPNWKRDKWRRSSICTRRILSDSMNHSPQKSYTQTLSAFYVTNTKKIIICNAQFQNLIFTGYTRLTPELEIKNCEISYIAIRTKNCNYFHLNLDTLTSAPTVDRNSVKSQNNNGSYIVDMASFPKSSDSWVQNKYAPCSNTYYYLLKELPPPPPSESYSSEPPSSQCLLC
jgi:hypothetical protein